MKGRDRAHYRICLLLIGIFLCSFYVSYAAEADVALQEVDQLDKLASAFSFSEDRKDYKLDIISGGAIEDNYEPKEGAVTSLDGFLEYNKKTLCISGTEAIDLTSFLNGSVNLQIGYGLIQDYTTKENRTVVEDISTGVCDLGNVPLFLSVDEPYWRIINKNGAWGIGIPNIGVPDEIYRLIPANLTGLLGYNTIEGYKNGKVQGAVSIGCYQKEQTKIPSTTQLGNLNLPGKIKQEIVANGVKYSTLEIVANYYFSVPIILDEKTSHKLLNGTKDLDFNLFHLPQIQGKITFRHHIKVFHDS